MADVVENNVDTKIPGIYKVIYEAKDGNGSTESCSCGGMTNGNKNF